MTVNVSQTAPMAHQEKTAAAALMEYSKLKWNIKTDDRTHLVRELVIQDIFYTFEVCVRATGVIFPPTRIRKTLPVSPRNCWP